MNIFGGSNQGRGLGTGKPLKEVRVKGRSRTIIVTRSAGTSDSQHKANLATARRHANQKSS